MSKVQRKNGGRYRPGDINLDTSSNLLVKLVKKYNSINSIYHGFDSFLTYSLPLTLEKLQVGVKDTNNTVNLKLTGVVPSPMSSPFQAIEQLASYEGKLLGKLVYNDTKRGESFEGEEMNLIDFPAMTGSILDPSRDANDLFDRGGCPYYPKGIVIIKGRQKHVIQEIKLRNNMVMMYKENEDKLYEGTIVCSVTTMDVSGKTAKIIIYGPNPKLEGSKKCWLYLPTFGMGDKNIRNKMELFYAFSLLGETNTDKVKSLIKSFANEEHYALLDSVMDGNECDDVKSILSRAKGAIGLSTNMDFQQVVIDDIYPIVDSIKVKLNMLAYMSCKFFMYLGGLKEPDSRDAVGWTRLETAEALMMKMCAKKLVKYYEKVEFKAPESSDIKNGYRNYLNANKSVLNLNTFGVSIINAFTTGNWDVKSSKNNTEKGLSEDIKPESLLKIYAIMSKNASSSSDQGAQKEARLFNPTQSGINDPKDCHEGKNIGLKRQLCTSAIISVNRSPVPVLNVIHPYLSLNGIDKAKKREVPCLLNGIIRGWCNPKQILSVIRSHRMNGELTSYIDMLVCYDSKENEVQLDTGNPGRMLRPLLVATPDGKSTYFAQDPNREYLTAEELLEKGYVEYVDAYACERSCLIAESMQYQRNRVRELEILEQTGDYDAGIATRNGFIVPKNKSKSMTELVKNRVIKNRKDCMKYTHVEIDESSSDSYAGSQVPGADHSLAGKSAYGANLAKQCISANNSNYRIANTNVMTSFYRSRPIADTIQAESIGLDVIPQGRGQWLAIDCGNGGTIYGGTNQEDASDHNESPIQRGLNYYFRPQEMIYEHKQSAINGTVEIQLPNYITDKYTSLDYRGIIKTHSFVEKHDVLISRIVIDETGKTYHEDIVYESQESGIVDDVVVVTHQDKYQTITIKVLCFRMPIHGSKFTPRSGNKGVAGGIYQEKYSKRLENGICPDITINSLGYISRQTWTLLLEMTISTASAVVGMRVNATSFSKDVSSQKYMDLLRINSNGDQYGNCQMYDGRTGLPLKGGNVAFGLVYILPNDHMPEDQANFVARPIQRIPNNQYPKGKKVSGSSRMGGMEMVTIMATGAAELHHSMYGYDNLTLPFCDKCGLIATFNYKGSVICNTCEVTGEKYKVYKVQFSGAQRHLLQQVSTQGIMIRHFPVPSKKQQGFYDETLTLDEENHPLVLVDGQ